MRIVSRKLMINNQICVNQHKVWEAKNKHSIELFLKTP